MVADLRIFLVHAPVEHDRGAGVELVVQLLCFVVFGEQFLVNIGKVRIANEYICSELAAILSKTHFDHFHLINIDLLHRRVVDEFHAKLFCDLDQCLNARIHPAHRIPDTFSQLRILQQGVGGRRVVWA